MEASSSLCSMLCGCETTEWLAYLKQRLHNILHLPRNFQFKGILHLSLVGTEAACHPAAARASAERPQNWAPGSQSQAVLSLRALHAPALGLFFPLSFPEGGVSFLWSLFLCNVEV